MNLTLTVSIGVTAKIASATPAPRPHNNRFPAVKLPLESALCFFNSSKAPNLFGIKIQCELKIEYCDRLILFIQVYHLTADFGIDP